MFLFNVRKSSNVYFKHNPSNIELSSKVGIRSQIFDKKSKKLFNDFVVIKQNIYDICKMSNMAFIPQDCFIRRLCSYHLVSKDDGTLLIYL